MHVNLSLSVMAAFLGVYATYGLYYRLESYAALTFKPKIEVCPKLLDLTHKRAPWHRERGLTGTTRLSSKTTTKHARQTSRR